jgi:hypothetical protein
VKSRAPAPALVLLLIVGLTGCARHYSPDAVSDPYGFFSGIWHGLILTITVAVNLLSWLLGLVGISFLDSVQIIGRPNTGFGYWAGFVFGVCAVGGSARN